MSGLLPASRNWLLIPPRVLPAALQPSYGEGSAALDAVDKDLIDLHDELPPFPEGDWQQEALAELGNDSTIDDAEIDSRLAAAALVNEATDVAMSGQAADARTVTGLKLIEHVETVAAHPWKEADLTTVPGHDASSRDEVIDRLDQLLRECGLATTRELSKEVAPPKELEMVNVWGGQARDQVAANKIRSLSFFRQVQNCPSHSPATLPRFKRSRIY